MIIKFELPSGGFSIIDNAKQVKYKIGISIPEMIYAVIDKSVKTPDIRYVLYDNADELEACKDECLSGTCEYFDVTNSDHLSTFSSSISLSNNLAIDESNVYYTDYTSSIITDLDNEDHMKFPYRLVEFILDDKSYRVLTSLYVYLCNDNGKTIETIK